MNLIPLCKQRNVQYWPILACYLLLSCSSKKIACSNKPTLVKTMLPVWNNADGASYTEHSGKTFVAVSHVLLVIYDILCNIIKYEILFTMVTFDTIVPDIVEKTPLLEKASLNIFSSYQISCILELAIMQPLLGLCQCALSILLAIYGIFDDVSRCDKDVTMSVDLVIRSPCSV